MEGRSIDSEYVERDIVNDADRRCMDLHTGQLMETDEECEYCSHGSDERLLSFDRESINVRGECFAKKKKSVVVEQGFP
jgi:hypothetical protein